MNFIRFVFLPSLLLFSFSLKAEEIDFNGKDILIGKYLEMAEDTNNSYEFPNFPTSTKFVRSEFETPNLGLSKSTYWIKFTVRNVSEDPKIFLELAYPMLHSCELYSLDSGKVENRSILETYSFSEREVNHQSIVFKLLIGKNASKTFFLTGTYS